MLNSIKQRSEELMEQYPEIISKLINQAINKLEEFKHNRGKK